MYKILSKSLSRPDKSLASFTSIYRRVANNQLFQNHPTTSETKNLHPQNRDEDLEAENLAKNSQPKKNSNFLKRPLCPEAKDTVHIMMFSTSSSKYFYSSTLNQASDSPSHRKKYFKNHKALDLYKQALEQCMKIKFEKHRIQKGTRNITWTPEPYRVGPISELNSSTSKKKKDANLIKADPKKPVRLYPKKSISVEDMKQMVKQKKSLRTDNKKKTQIVYPTHIIKYKLGLQKPYKVEQCMAKKMKPVATTMSPEAEPDKPVVKREINTVEVIPSKNKRIDNLGAVMAASRQRRDKNDKSFVAEIDESIKHLISKHPAMKKVTESAKMSITKKYNIILLKNQAKIRLQMKPREATTGESADKVLTKPFKASDQSETEKSDKNIIQIALDDDTNIVQHPISMNQANIELTLKYPKRILSEKNETYDIEQICLKTKESYVIYTDEISDALKNIIKDKPENKAIKQAEPSEEKNIDKVEGQSPMKHSVEHKLKEAVLSKMKQDKSQRIITTNQTPESAAQRLNEYLKKLNELKDQTSMERSRVRSPFSKMKKNGINELKETIESDDDIGGRIEKAEQNKMQKSIGRIPKYMLTQNKTKSQEEVDQTTSKLSIDSKKTEQEVPTIQVVSKNSQLRNIMKQYIVTSTPKSEITNPNETSTKPEQQVTEPEKEIVEKIPEGELSPHNEEAAHAEFKGNIDTPVEEKMLDNSPYKDKLKNLLEPANQYFERLREAGEEKMKNLEALKDQFKSQIAGNIYKGLNMKYMLENMTALKQEGISKKVIEEVENQLKNNSYRGLKENTELENVKKENIYPEKEVPSSKFIVDNMDTQKNKAIPKRRGSSCLLLVKEPTQEDEDYDVIQIELAKESKSKVITDVKKQDNTTEQHLDTEGKKTMPNNRPTIRQDRPPQMPPPKNNGKKDEPARKNDIILPPSRPNNSPKLKNSLKNHLSKQEKISQDEGEDNIVENKEVKGERNELASSSKCAKDSEDLEKIVFKNKPRPRDALDADFIPQKFPNQQLFKNWLYILSCIEELEIKYKDGSDPKLIQLAKEMDAVEKNLNNKSPAIGKSQIEPNPDDIFKLSRKLKTVEEDIQEEETNEVQIEKMHPNRLQSKESTPKSAYSSEQLSKKKVENHNTNRSEATIGKENRMTKQNENRNDSCTLNMTDYEYSSKNKEVPKTEQNLEDGSMIFHPKPTLIKKPDSISRKNELELKLSQKKVWTKTENNKLKKMPEPTKLSTNNALTSSGYKLSSKKDWKPKNEPKSSPNILNKAELIKSIGGQKSTLDEIKTVQITDQNTSKTVDQNTWKRDEQERKNIVEEAVGDDVKEPKATSETGLLRMYLLDENEAYDSFIAEIERKMKTSPSNTANKADIYKSTVELVHKQNFKPKPILDLSTKKLSTDLRSTDNMLQKANKLAENPQFTRKSISNITKNSIPEGNLMKMFLLDENETKENVIEKQAKPAVQIGLSMKDNLKNNSIKFDSSKKSTEPTGKTKSSKSLEGLNTVTCSSDCFADYFKKGKKKQETKVKTTAKQNEERSAEETKLDKNSREAKSKEIKKTVLVKSVKKEDRANNVASLKSEDKRPKSAESNHDKMTKPTELGNSVTKIKTKSGTNNLQNKDHKLIYSTIDSDKIRDVKEVRTDIESSVNRREKENRSGKTENLLKTAIPEVNYMKQTTSNSSKSKVAKADPSEESKTKQYEVTKGNSKDKPNTSGKKQKVIIRLNRNPNFVKHISKTNYTASTQKTKENTNKTIEAPKHLTKMKEEPKTVMDHIIDDQMKKRLVKAEKISQETKILKKKYHNERLQRIMDKYRADIDKIEDHYNHKIVPAEVEISRRRKYKEDAQDTFKKKIDEINNTNDKNAKKQIEKVYIGDFNGDETTKETMKSNTIRMRFYNKSCLLKNVATEVKQIAQANTSENLLENQVMSRMKDKRGNEGNYSQLMGTNNRTVKKQTGSNEYVVESKTNEGIKRNKIFSNYVDILRANNQRLLNNRTTEMRQVVRAKSSKYLLEKQVDNMRTMKEMRENQKSKSELIRTYNRIELETKKGMESDNDSSSYADVLRPNNVSHIRNNRVTEMRQMARPKYLLGNQVDIIGRVEEMREKHKEEMKSMDNMRSNRKKMFQVRYKIPHKGHKKIVPKKFNENEIRERYNKYLLENQLPVEFLVSLNRELKKALPKEMKRRESKSSMSKYLLEKTIFPNGKIKNMETKSGSKSLHSYASVKTSERLKAKICRILPELKIIKKESQYANMIIDTDSSSIFPEDPKCLKNRGRRDMAEIREIFHRSEKLLKFNKKLAGHTQNTTESQSIDSKINEFLVTDSDKVERHKKLFADFEKSHPTLREKVKEAPRKKLGTIVLTKHVEKPTSKLTKEKVLPIYRPKKKEVENKPSVRKCCDKLCVPPKKISQVFHSQPRDDINTLTKCFSDKIVSIPEKQGSKFNKYDKYKHLKISFIPVNSAEKRSKSEHFLPALLNGEQKDMKDQNPAVDAKILAFRRELLKKLKEEFDFLNDNQNNFHKVRDRYEKVLKEITEKNDNESVFKYPIIQEFSKKEKKKKNVIEVNTDHVPKNNTEMLLKKLSEKESIGNENKPDEPKNDPKKK